MVETAPFLEAIRGDLAAVAAGDEAATAVVERFGRALESSLQLRLFDVMGQAALELSEQMSGGHVEVRLAGRDVQLVHVAEVTSSTRSRRHRTTMAAPPDSPFACPRA